MGLETGSRSLIRVNDPVLPFRFITLECSAYKIWPLSRLMPYLWHTFIVLDAAMTVDVICIISAVNLMAFGPGVEADM